MSKNKKNTLPISLEQDLILHNYIYELYQNKIIITNYKKHLANNSFEAFLIKKLNKKDYILSLSLYYLNYLILNDKIITNSSLNFVNLKNKDAYAEIYSDVLNILPLCSQIYVLLEKGNYYDELNSQMFAIYKLCKNMHLLGQQITSLYFKNGDFINEFQVSYLDLVKRQLKSDIEKDLASIYSELKNLKKYLLEKDLALFDIISDLKNKLFSKYFTNEEKDKTKLVKISLKPFIYWNENRNNLLSIMNLKFLKENYPNSGKEIDELEQIEIVSTSLIFFFEYEENFWKSKANNTISLKFFMDNHSLMKYSYVLSNEDEIKDFLKKYYNFSSLDSYAFKKSVGSLITDISNKNKNNILAIFDEISRKIPSHISDNNFIIASSDKKEKEELIEVVAIKSYEIFIESFTDEK